jgi:hypothetical protein
MRPYVENNKSKKGWDVAQVVEHLPNKHKALCSNPNTTCLKFLLLMVDFA